MRTLALVFLGMILVARAPALAGDASIVRKNRRTLDQIDAIYDSMPPVRSTPPPDRWKYVPRTQNGWNAAVRSPS
jgi:hypothetical protein